MGRLLSETRLVRSSGSPSRAGPARDGAERHRPNFAGLADAAMHSPFKRDEAGSIPASRTTFVYGGASSNWIRTEPSELLNVGSSPVRLPMNGDVVQRIEGARLRTLRSEFNSLHPFQFVLAWSNAW